MLTFLTAGEPRGTRDVPGPAESIAERLRERLVPASDEGAVGDEDWSSLLGRLDDAARRPGR